MLGQKIKQLRLSNKLTQKEFAKLFGLSESMVSLYESGSRQPSFDVLKKVAEQFNVSTDFLLSDNMMLFPLKKGVKIPVLGRVPAGKPIEAVESVIGWEEIPVEWTSGGETYFGLVVHGDSMYPKYLEDDTVIIKKQECCDSGQDAVVIVDGNDATLKKVIYNESGVILQPYNSTHTPMFYTRDDIESVPVIILGVVVELRRKII